MKIYGDIRSGNCYKIKLLASILDIGIGDIEAAYQSMGNIGANSPMFLLGSYATLAANTLDWDRVEQAAAWMLEADQDDIRRVSEHMVERLETADANGFEPLHLIPTKDGESYARLASGSWRTFVYIDGTESHDRCESPEQAYEAARAFGWFQRQLLDLSPDDLGETLKDFFSSPVRLAQFERALAQAAPERIEEARESIAFVQDRAGMVTTIEDELRDRRRDREHRQRADHHRRRRPAVRRL